MRKIYKVLCWAVAAIAVVVVVVVVCTLLLNTKYVQNRVLHKATAMLSEQLDTRVEIDSVFVNIVGQSVHLYGLSIDDREGRPLLHMDRLAVNMKLLPLLKRNVVVRSAEVEGVDALLLKDGKDSTANFQFIIDAFKPGEKSQQTSVGDTLNTGKKERLTTSISQVRLNNIHVRYNNTNLWLLTATYEEKGTGEGSEVDFDGLRLTTDNGKPRRNTGKPHHGFFDAGHMDISISGKMGISHVGKDSVVALLHSCHATDSVAGFDVRDLTSTVVVRGDTVALRQLRLQQRNTVLNIAEARLTLPNKKTGQQLTYTATDITGKAVLQDIARPFAPVLGNFTMPLDLSLDLCGNADTMNFKNVKVNTADKLLKVAATGRITNLSRGKLLVVHFDVGSMVARSSIKEKVISQFPVKRMMMTQLHRLGNISYRGSFDVVWKKEMFRGLLHTEAGAMKFQFAIDEKSKYVSGKVSSEKFLLGKVMDMEHLGSVACSANFNIDISKPRTARMRKEKGGKLPIGNVSATIDDCSYHGIHLRHLHATIDSDGALASGDIVQEGKWRDVYCSFSFTNTDEMHRLKVIHPGVKFHKKRKKEK